MADKSAGEASVKIVPDAKNFIRDLEADLKRRKAEFAVNVTADTARAALDIDRFRKEQERNAVNLKVNVDTSSAERSLSKLFGGSSGGGGGFGGGGSFWTGPIGIPLIFTGIGELPAATTAITNVVGAIQQLSGAGAALPGVFGGLASEVGTVKLAMDGVGDAFKALDKASDGSAANVKAANDALAKLAPSAADFVRQVHDLTPAFDDLKKTVQGNFFEGLGTSVRQLADADLPVLNKGLGGIATALNGSLKQIGISLSSGSSQGLLDRIFGNTAEAQGRLTAAIDPLIKGLGTITAAGSDVLPRLADDIGSVAQRFSAFITEADQNGTLSKFINDGITGVENLGNTFVNVGKIINDITSAAGGDGGLLKFLDEGSNKLHAFLSSTEGQNKLKEWFEEGRRELNEHVIPLLKSLPGIFEGIVSAGQTFADTIVPPIRDVAKFLGEHPDALRLAIEGIVAAATLSKVATLLSSLQTISGLLGGGAGGGGAGGKGGLTRALGAGLALGGVLGSAATDSSDPNSRPESGLSALATIGGGAITGASVAGPWGAAVGALIGGAAALTDAFLDQANRVNAIEQKERDRIAKEHDAGVPPSPVIAPGSAVQPAPSPLPVANGQTGTTNVTDPTKTTGLGLVAAGIDQPKLVASQAQAAADDLQHLRDLITTLPTGQVTLKEDTPQAIEALTKLGVKVTQIPGGTVNVDASSLANALAKAEQLHSTLLSIGGAAAAASSAVNNASSTPLHIGSGFASGGVLPGYSPGVDNMLVPLAGGEGIVRPEAVRKYGPGVIHMLNSGFADGGITPHLGTGALPGPADGGASLTGGGILGGILGHLFGGSNSTTSSDGKKDPASWLGEFGAKTLTSFATTLFSGALGFFGLSSSNPYIQDIAKLIFGADGTTDSGSGSSKAATPKQLREASDKITDKKNAVDVAQARVDGLKPTASASSRLSATNALTKAQREASEAIADLAAIQQPSVGYAKGGIVGVSKKGYADAGIVPPRPKPTDIIPLQPRTAPKAAPRPSVPAPSSAPVVPVPVPTVAPSDPAPSTDGTFRGGSYSATPVSSVGSHTLPAISTGITSGFATAGNLASAALSGGGGMGIPGAGQAVSGLFQQAGKIANDVADVGSALLVGNVPGSFGDPNLPAYGQTLRPAQNVPVTAAGPSYTFNGISDINRLTQVMDLRDAQDQQASMAHRRPR